MTDSYGLIDRYLRNNLGDDDYAEYSAALEAIAVRPVPHGYKLVPVQPTPEMLLKIYKSTGVARSELRDLYAALIAAAPEGTP